MKTAVQLVIYLLLATIACTASLEAGYGHSGAKETFQPLSLQPMYVDCFFA